MLKVFRKNTELRQLVWRAISLLLACNYFAFRTELFSEEYEQNNPVKDPFTHQVAYSLPSLNWETFDKDNATKAFVINPPIKIFVIGVVPQQSIIAPSYIPSFEPIRDKSPPPDLIVL